MLARTPASIRSFFRLCPQTSVKVVGGCGTSVAHTLAMTLDERTMDDDLGETPATHEIEIGHEWADVD